MPERTRRGRVARNPSIAVASDRTYVVGNDVAFFDAEFFRGPGPENPLTVWEVGGADLGRPAGRFTYVYPKAVVDGRGRLHVLWGEQEGGPYAASAARWPRIPSTSIWTSSFERSRGWSAPAPLHRAPIVSWASTFVAAPQQNADGSLGFAVPTSNGAGSHAMIYLRFQGDRWEAIPVAIPAAAGYGSLSTVDGHVFIGYIAADISQRQDGNSVFLLRSSDGGASWLGARLVSRSGNHPAYEVRTLIAPDGVLHLVWRQMVAGGAVLRHVASRDNGETFSAPDDVVPPAGFAGVNAVMDRCGTIHVVYEDWAGGGEGGHLDHVVWNGRWSTPDHLFTSLRSNSADLRATPDGGLMLAFLAQPADAPLTAPIASVYSLWRSK